MNETALDGVDAELETALFSVKSCCVPRIYCQRGPASECPDVNEPKKKVKPLFWVFSIYWVNGVD